MSSTGGIIRGSDISDRKRTFQDICYKENIIYNLPLLSHDLTLGGTAPILFRIKTNFKMQVNFLYECIV